MVVFSLFFGELAGLSSGGVPYPIFSFTALLPWQFFENGVTKAGQSLVMGRNLVTKVYFPRELLPTAAVLTKVVDLALGLIILVGMMAYYGYPPEWTLAWVPVLFAIHLVFILGLALPLAALNLFFHDVRFLVGVVLTLWFYITPVIYPVDLVPDKYRILFDLNPNSLFINAYRRVVLQGISPGEDRLLLGLTVAVLTFIVGYFLFKRMESGFADRI